MERNWKTRIEHNMEFALDKLKADGQMPALVVIEAKNEPLRVFSLTFGDTQEKQAAWSMITLAGIAFNAEAISILNEVWVATEQLPIDTSPADVARKARPPSEREDRKEMVMCLVLYRDPIDDESRRTMCEMREIERGADGRVINLIKDEEPNDSFAGSMLDLMTPERPPLAAQRHAREGIEALLGLGVLGMQTIPLR